MTCHWLQVNPRLPRLQFMRVADVCRMITDIDGITSGALPRYLDIVRENNINGVVLLQCDLAELKPVMRMTFGDWELFRRYVEAMREREYTEPSSQEVESAADIQTQFTQAAPGMWHCRHSHSVLVIQNQLYVSEYWNFTFCKFKTVCTFSQTIANTCLLASILCVL